MFYPSPIAYRFLHNRLWSRKSAKNLICNVDFLVWIRQSLCLIIFADVHWLQTSNQDTKTNLKLKFRPWQLIFPRSKENLLKINFINHLAYVTVTVCKSHLSARKLVFACEWLIILGFKSFFNLNACLFLTFKSSKKNIISRRHGLVHRYGNDNCLESNYPLFWALNGLLLKCSNNIDENRGLISRINKT